MTAFLLILIFATETNYEEEALNSMLLNWLLAWILIYFVMASLVESLLFPAAIWTQIIFAVLGVVLNNGIVLVDYINQLLARLGLNRSEAILQAGNAPPAPDFNDHWNDRAEAGSALPCYHPDWAAMGLHIFQWHD